LIAYLKPRILNRTSHAVIGAGPAERDKMPARFQRAKHKRPCVGTKGNVAAVPLLVHKIKMVRRITYHGVDAALVELCQHLEAIAPVQRHLAV
jgi:hypothetical protein